MHLDDVAIAIRHDSHDGSGRPVRESSDPVADIVGSDPVPVLHLMGRDGITASPQRIDVNAGVELTLGGVLRIRTRPRRMTLRVFAWPLRRELSNIPSCIGIAGTRLNTLRRG